MKDVIIVCIIIGMTLNSCMMMPMKPPAPPSVLSQDSHANQLAERLLLVTIPMAPMSQLMQVAEELSRDYQIQNRAAWALKSLWLHCVVYEVEDNRAPQSVLAQLAGDPRIESAQTMQVFHLLTDPYNDPYRHLQKNLLSMNMDKVHTISTGKGVKIAIIDTGIDKGHPDLNNQVLITKNFVNPKEQPMKGERHGTAVAGIIAATGNNDLGIVGVAPDSQLLALKACWESAESDQGLCSTFTLAQALNFAIEQQADILNLSLSGPSDPLISRLIETAKIKNIVVVAADNQNNPGLGFPAAIPSVIGVQATTLTTSVQKVIKNQAENNVSAPGIDILTTMPKNSYDFVSGGSFATAHISGIAAILKQHQPTLTPSQIHGHLLEGSHLTAFGDHYTGVSVDPWITLGLVKNN